MTETGSAPSSYAETVTISRGLKTQVPPVTSQSVPASLGAQATPLASTRLVPSLSVAGQSPMSTASERTPMLAVMEQPVGGSLVCRITDVSPQPEPVTVPSSLTSWDLQVSLFCVFGFIQFAGTVSIESKLSSRVSQVAGSSMDHVPAP